MLSICAWRLHSSLTPGRQPPDDTTTGCTLNTRKKKEGSGASYVLSCRIGPQAHVEVTSGKDMEEEIVCNRW